jgi:uncharacterized membrane protein YccC
VLSRWFASLADRFFAADHGLIRLRFALRAVCSVSLAVVVLTLLHLPATSLLLGAVFSMISSTSLRTGTVRERGLHLLLYAPVMGTSLSAATLLAPYPLFADAAFVAVMFVGVYLRRFDQTGAGLGMGAFMAFFFALFLHPGVAALPTMYLAGAIGLACCGIMALLVFRDTSASTLRRTTLSIRAQVARLIEELAALLEDDDPDLDDGDGLPRRISRQAQRMHEATLQIEDSADLLGLDPQWQRQLVDAELSADRLARTIVRALGAGLGRDTRQDLARDLRGLHRFVDRDPSAALTLDTDELMTRIARYDIRGDAASLPSDPAHHVLLVHRAIRELLLAVVQIRRTTERVLNDPDPVRADGTSRREPTLEDVDQDLYYDDPDSPEDDDGRSGTGGSESPWSVDASGHGAEPALTWDEPAHDVTETPPAFTSARPSAAEPDSELGAVAPGSAEPGAVAPGSAEPGAVEPGSAEPGSVEPSGVEPGAAGPGAAGPSRVEPTAAGPPKHPEPAQHTERAHTEPAQPTDGPDPAEHYHELPYHLRAAVQAAIGGLLGIIGGTLLSGQRWYWAVIAGFIVFAGTNSRGDLLVKGWRRVLGTMLGIVFGTVLATLLSGHPKINLVVLLLCIFLAFYSLRVSYATMTFFITVMLGMLYDILGEFSPDLLLLRLEETAVGVTGSVVAAMLVLPKRTRTTVLTELHDYFTALHRELSDAERLLVDADRVSVIAATREVDRAATDVRTAISPMLYRLSPSRVRRGHATRLLTLTEESALTARNLARAAEPGALAPVPEAADALHRMIGNIEVLLAATEQQSGGRPVDRTLHKASTLVSGPALAPTVDVRALLEGRAGGEEPDRVAVLHLRRTINSLDRLDKLLLGMAAPLEQTISVPTAGLHRRDRRLATH